MIGSSKFPSYRIKYLNRTKMFLKTNDIASTRFLITDSRSFINGNRKTQKKKSKKDQIVLTLIGLVKYIDVIYRLYWQEWEPALATTFAARI